MGFIEAKEDKIKIINGRGYTIYYPKCYICGAEIKCMTYSRETRYRCKQCKLNDYLADKKIKNKINNDKKEIKFNNAVKRIKKMLVKILKNMIKP